MRARALALLAAITLTALVAWQAAPGQAEGADPRLRDRGLSQSEPEFAPRQIVVRYRDGVSELAVRVQSATYDGRVLEKEARSGLYRLAVPAGVDVDSVLAAYEESPFVEEAGRSLVARAFETPNDTNYSYQWHLHNTVGGMWAENAWDLSANKGQGVVVAVIDTGVAYENHDGLLAETFPQHFELAPDLAGTPFVFPIDLVNNDTHANDDNGHGSHVTGTITQDTNNNYGVAGVAYNSTIMPVKVLDYSGFGADANLVESLYYAVDHGADVISMSLGFTGTGAPDANGNVCTEIVGLNAALDYAYQNGVVVVAAAGNDGTGTVSCPAAYPTVIAAAATRFDGQIAPYSNGGSALDIAAPGGDPNLDQNRDRFSDGVVQETYCYDWLTLFFLGTYDRFCDVFISGTSMATPHVSGTAALLLGENPSLAPAQVRFYLESTARDRGAAGWDAVYGWGVLDAHAALAALLGVSPPTPTPTATPTATRTPTPTPTPTNTPAAPGQPDLAETAVSNPPSSANVGSRFRVTDTVRNQGTATASSSRTRFYLSLDTERGAGDVLLSGTRSVSSLAVGASSTGRTWVQVPSGTAAGLYYVIACGDDTLRVTESNEANNCRASASQVQVN